MLPRIVIASLALCLVSVTQADEPQWLKDARAREGKAVKPAAIKSKDKWFTAQAPAKVVGDIVKEKGSYTITLDVGSDAMVYCEVMPDGIDMGDMLRRTYDETMKQVEGSLGKVEARALEFSDAGAYGDVPFIELRWIYRVNDGKEAHVGALKQSIIEKFGHDIYCAHLDLGYVKTFDDITRALAESFVAPPATPAPYYLEISTVSVGGRKLGLGITRLQRDEDGDTKATIMGAMVQATPDGKLRSRDSLDLSWVHPDGSLINAAYTASQDGAVVGDATLKPVDDVWVIAGEANGKKLDAKLAAGVQPDTWIEQALGVRKLLASPEAIGVETVSSLWTSNDLTRLTDEKLKVTAKKSAEEYTAHIDLGPLSAEAVIDAKLGVPKAADFPVGSETMHLERVYQSGNF